MLKFDDFELKKGAKITIEETDGNEVVGFYVRHSGDTIYLSRERYAALRGEHDSEYKQSERKLKTFGYKNHEPSYPDVPGMHFD